MTKLIIFDFNRTLFDPEKNKLQTGALKMLAKLKSRGYELRLLAQAHLGRIKLIEALGLNEFFNSVHLVKNKGQRELLQICAQSKIAPQNCYVVGDRVRKEIASAKKIGAKAIWLKRGKFAAEIPQFPREAPDYTVRSLKKLLEIF